MAPVNTLYFPVSTVRTDADGSTVENLVRLAGRWHFQPGQTDIQAMRAWNGRSHDTSGQVWLAGPSLGVADIWCGHFPDSSMPDIYHPEPAIPPPHHLRHPRCSVRSVVRQRSGPAWDCIMSFRKHKFRPVTLRWEACPGAPR